MPQPEYFPKFQLNTMQEVHPKEMGLMLISSPVGSTALGKERILERIRLPVAKRLYGC